jgi:hypothetical protein
MLNTLPKVKNADRIITNTKIYWNEKI